MFHYYTLKEVYEFAEKKGYKPEDVKIERIEYEHEDTVEYEVSFGRVYTEMWLWIFEDLDAPATEYEHEEWDD